MAPRKINRPKGLIDDIKEGIQAADDFIRGRQRPVETQNLAEFKDTLRTTLKVGGTAADVYFTGGMAGSLTRNVIAPGSTVSSLSTKAKKEKAGLMAFGKDAAIAGVAAGAGAVAPAIGRTVAKTGVPSRIFNKLTKQEVLLHGRKTSGYTQIKPAGGIAEGNPELQKYAYSWYDNPAVNPGGDLAQSYAGNTGTVYAVRGKRSTFINDANRSVAPNFNTDQVIASQVNQKVVGSVNMSGLTPGQRKAAIEKMAKRAGARIAKK